MVACSHCLSNDISYALGKFGIQEHYKCNNCGIEYFKHKGIDVTDFGICRDIDFRKFYERYMHGMQ